MPMCAPSMRKSHLSHVLAFAGFSCPPPARGFRQRANNLSYLCVFLGLAFSFFIMYVRSSCFGVVRSKHYVPFYVILKPMKKKSTISFFASTQTNNLYHTCVQYV